MAGKNIVVLSDGTWSKWESDDSKATNVQKLCRLLVDDPGQGQITHYDPGVGTDFFRLTGGAFGVGVSENIRQAYRFISAHYEPKDRIYLFGFSRGAFTVRSLGGMIAMCGIQFPWVDRTGEAFRIYVGKEETAAARFRFHYSHPSRVIQVIGVWDTVGALGVPFETLNKLNPLSHRFHDTTLAPTVRYGFQAVALDEDRPLFEPTLWDESKSVPPQIVEQVWFAGTHMNVGGGYYDTGLSDIALRWMVERNVVYDTGLLFKPTANALPAGHANGSIQDGRQGLFRLWRAEPRHVSDNSKIHVSVRERIRAMSSYNPPLPERYSLVAPTPLNLRT